MKQNKVLSTQGDVRKNQMGFDTLLVGIVWVLIILALTVWLISYFIHSLINKVVKIFKKQKGKDK